MYDPYSIPKKDFVIMAVVKKKDSKAKAFKNMNIGFSKDLYEKIKEKAEKKKRSFKAQLEYDLEIFYLGKKDEDN